MMALEMARGATRTPLLSPGGTRTHNLQFTRPVLYPVELRMFVRLQDEEIQSESQALTMTPAERARQIDKEEFEAECAAIRQRAIAYSSQRRREDREAFLAAAAREPVVFTRRRTIHRRRTPMPVVEPMKPTAMIVDPTSLKPKVSKPKPKPIRAAIEPRRITIDGVAMTRREWAEHLGISLSALNTRVSRLGSIEAAIRLGSAHRHPVTANGMTKSLSAWAGYFGIAWSTFRRRVQAADDAHTAIVRLLNGDEFVESRRGPDGHSYTFDGRTLTLAEWASVTGLNSETIRSRLKNHWSIEAALTTPPRISGPGVPSDFAPLEGTGGGSTAQETPNLSF